MKNWSLHEYLWVLFWSPDTPFYLLCFTGVSTLNSGYVNGRCTPLNKLIPSDPSPHVGFFFSFLSFTLTQVLRLEFTVTLWSRLDISFCIHWRSRERLRKLWAELMNNFMRKSGHCLNQKLSFVAPLILFCPPPTDKPSVLEFRLEFIQTLKKDFWKNIFVRNQISAQLFVIIFSIKSLTSIFKWLYKVGVIVHLFYFIYLLTQLFLFNSTQQEIRSYSLIWQQWKLTERRKLVIKTSQTILTKYTSF